MSKELILEKFEQYKKDGLSNRDAMKRIREELMELIKAEVADKGKKQVSLKGDIDQMMANLKSLK